jgi:hypothetical protein
MCAGTFTASITTEDGTIETYKRHGNSERFVIFGRDAAGVRKGERPIVAEWCASEQGARNVLPDWQRYGGQWAILPVTYTDHGQR